MGETFEELQSRTDHTLETLLPRIEEMGAHTRILLFAHAATCITLIRSLATTDAKTRDLRIGCCSLTTLHRKDGLSGVEKGTSKSSILDAYRIVGLGEAHFLTNGVERDWGFSDITVDETGTVVEDPGEPGTEGQIEDHFGLQYHGPAARM